MGSDDRKFVAVPGDKTTFGRRRTNFVEVIEEAFFAGLDRPEAVGRAEDEGGFANKSLSARGLCVAA